jgi:GTPase
MAKVIDQRLVTDVGVAFTGSADSGKSSLIGVLTTDILDNGKGSARAHVAKHPHEINTGQTSDISTRVIAFNNGKLLTCIDTCGQEKYLKTTTFALTGHYPDYAIVIISANRDILPMTEEHLKILVHMEVPVIFVVTRIDLAPKKIYEGILNKLNKFGKKMGRIIDIMEIDFDDLDKDKNKEIFDGEKKDKNMNDVISTKLEIEAMKRTQEMADNLFKTCDYSPVITVSNKTGYFIPVLKNLLSQLKPRPLWDSSKLDGTVFFIDAVFVVEGIGLVLSGITKGKSISTGDTLYLGPKGSKFYQVKVRSIHNNNRQQIDVLGDHHRGCIAITSLDKNVNRKFMEKGMTVVSKNFTKNVCFRFKALIEVQNHSATIKPNYCSVIHIGNIRQTVRLDKITKIIEQKKLVKHDEKDNDKSTPSQLGLSTGDKAEVIFKFKFNAQFLQPGTNCILREGATRAQGVVLETIPVEEEEDLKNTQPDPERFQKMRKKKVRHVNPNKDQLVLANN